MSEKRDQKNITRVALFIFCGLPGILLVLACTLGLISELDIYFRGKEKIFKFDEFALLVLLTTLGSVLLLLGIGKLKEWLYIFTFLSLPLCIGLTIYISSVTGSFWVSIAGLVVSFLSPFVVNKLIKKYYDYKTG